MASTGDGTQMTDDRDSYYPRQLDVISSQAAGVNVSAPRIVSVSQRLLTDMPQRREANMSQLHETDLGPVEPAMVPGVSESQSGRVVPKVRQSPPNAGISQL
eukprot:850626_1